MTIAPSAIAVGATASHVYVDRVCIDCPAVFRTLRNHKPPAKRCPACQAQYRVEMQREREQHRHGHYRIDVQRNIGGAYRIVHDPCGSWSSHGSLERGEIERLAQQGHLDTGMRWSNGKRVLEVVGRSVREVDGKEQG